MHSVSISTSASSSISSTSFRQETTWRQRCFLSWRNIRILTRRRWGFRLGGSVNLCGTVDVQVAEILMERFVASSESISEKLLAAVTCKDKVHQLLYALWNSQGTSSSLYLYLGVLPSQGYHRRYLYSLRKLQTALSWYIPRCRWGLSVHPFSMGQKSFYVLFKP